MPHYDNEYLVKNKFKFKLVEEQNTISSSRSIVFDVTPTFTETNDQQYSQIDIPHGPGTFMVYEHSKSRTFNIKTSLITRTDVEATKNIQRINLLRSWTKPSFGDNSRLSESFFQSNNNIQTNVRQNIMQKYSNGNEILGQPPKILRMSIYADSNHRGHLYRIPVVLSSVSFDYQDDVDYILSQDDVQGFEEFQGGTPFPAIMNVTLTLNETQTADQFSKFNLNAYRLGILEGF